MELKEISPNEFKAWVIDSAEPVVVDFWAPWCIPCKKLTPIVEEIAQGFVGKVKFGKFNIDSDRKLAAELDIMSIPTLLFFKGGQRVEEIHGLPAKEKIVEKVKGLIA